MIRFVLLKLCLIFSSLTLAATNYQVDLIIFANPQSNINESALDTTIPFVTAHQNAIPLGIGNKTNSTYQIMSPTLSGLKDQNYLLSRRSNYQVLGHFSWKQPAKNQSKIVLPKIDTKGWQIEGTLKVVQSSYYSVNAELQCSPPSFPDKSFTVSQTARVKGGEMYYFDHQHIGMLIKIHPIS
ncbi:CsiV family protein [Legionella waltersii]|uniref:Peptidoglycan-binding protein CsiV n=1 Tax=Legionella waltersii TaxID=66969 RepID=A0A0W1AAI3_9GAMM|nr:CsiV family protein [Legionella waltersii]KTD78353.1 hypothetical protein Lwal_1788 [Legionella waltersii]SNV06499.1 Protein of uncharacterised function (DUF2803) [Legionella waltersii]